MLLLLSAALAAEPLSLPWPYSTTLDWAGDTIAVGGPGGVAFYSAQGEARTAWRSRHEVYSVQLSADGSRALIQDERGRTTLLSSSGEELQRWRAGRWQQPGAALSPDGQTVLWCDATDCRLRRADGSEASIPNFRGVTSQIGFLDATHIYGGSQDNTLVRLSIDGAPTPEAVPLARIDGPIDGAGQAIFLREYSRDRIQRVIGDESLFFTLPGTDGNLFAPDPQGRFIAYGVRGSQPYAAAIAVYDPDTHQLYRPISAPISSVQQLAWSPDGHTLAVSTDGRLLFLEVPREPSRTPPLSEAVDLLGFTTDGRAAWALYASGEIWSWDLESGEGRRTGWVNLSRESWMGPPVARLPGQDAFAARSADGQVLAYGLDGAVLATLSGPVDREVRIVAAPDGAIAIATNEVLQRVSASGEALPPLPFHSVGAMALAPGGGAIAEQGWGSPVTIVDPESQKIIATIEGSTIDLRFLSDGSLAITNSEGRVTRWTAEGGATDQTTAALIAGSMPDTELVASVGTTLLMAGSGGDLLLRDARSGLWKGDIVHGWPWEYLLGYTAIALHPDGLTALTLNRFGTIQLWDLNERELVATLTGPLPAALAVTSDAEGRLYGSWADRGAGPADGAVALHRGSADVLDIDVSPDGRTLVLAHTDGTISRVQADNGEVLWSAAPFEYVARRVRFSADGARVYARDDAYAFVELDAATGEALPGPGGYGTSFGEQDGALWLWSGSALSLRTAEGWDEHPSGRRSWRMSASAESCAGGLVVGSDYFDGTAYYWASKLGKRPRPVRGERGVITSALACVGGKVVVADITGIIEVYEARDGALISRFEAGGPAVDLAPVGEDALAIALLNGEIRVVDLSGRTLRVLTVSDAPRIAPPDPVIESPEESP